MNKRVFKKYEFGSEELANSAIAALPSDEDGNPTHRHAVVKLGYLWTENPTYDNEGNILTEGVQSSKYSIDVLWDTTQLIDENGDVQLPWTQNEVVYDETWSNRNGAHTFAGWSFS